MTRLGSGMWKEVLLRKECSRRTHSGSDQSFATENSRRIRLCRADTDNRVQIKRLQGTSDALCELLCVSIPAFINEPEFIVIGSRALVEGRFSHRLLHAGATAV